METAADFPDEDATPAQRLQSKYITSDFNDVLRMGMDTVLAGQNNPQNKPLFVTTKYDVGSPVKDLSNVPSGSLLVSNVIFSTDPQIPLHLKVFNFFNATQNVRASIIAAPIQLPGGHYTAILRVQNSQGFNKVICFNTEGKQSVPGTPNIILPHPGSNKVVFLDVEGGPDTPEANERYVDFSKATNSTLIAMRGNPDKALTSGERLQDPNNKNDHTCPPRLIAFISHALSNAQVLLADNFDLEAFVHPMKSWNVAAMRTTQIRILEGETGLLKKTHTPTPDRPFETADKWYPALAK